MNYGGENPNHGSRFSADTDSQQKSHPEVEKILQTLSGKKKERYMDCARGEATAHP